MWRVETLQILTNLITIVTLCGMYSYYLHLINEETEAKKVEWFARVKELLMIRARIRTEAACLRVCSSISVLNQQNYNVGESMGSIPFSSWLWSVFPGIHCHCIYFSLSHLVLGHCPCRLFWILQNDLLTYSQPVLCLEETLWGCPVFLNWDFAPGTLDNV